MAIKSDDENETVMGLKERRAELKEEYRTLYDKLPPEGRVYVQRELREFDRSLRRLAQSREFYRGDKDAHERLARNGRRWFVAALVVLVGLELLQWVELLEIEERNEWVVKAIFAAAALAGWIEYFGSQRTLAVSARQYSRDETDFNALGARSWNRSEFFAALQYQNDFLEDDEEQFSYEEKELHYGNLRLDWRVSIAEDYLTAIGVVW